MLRAFKVYDVEKVRQDFPILSRKVNGKQLVYFDNAATAQKPNAVIEAIEQYYKGYNANIHRGIHRLAEEATLAYEDSRRKVAKFAGVKPQELVFTRGTTESLNLIMYAYAMTHLKKGDEIIATVMEHHSNIVPWFLLQSRLGVKVKFVDIDDGGKLRMEQYEQMITDKTKIITVTHASNVLGTINPVKDICKIAKKAGAISIVDGAQAVPHMEVDIKEIGCDFYCFSGHKMLGPTGIGALAGRQYLLEEMEPFHGGGEMIREVHLDGAKWNDLPWKFEAGTPNIEGGIILSKAAEYLQSLGMDKIRKHEEMITAYAMERLSEIPDAVIYGPESPKERGGVVSFNVADIHPHDMATILDSEGIAIRSGHHCAQPLIERLKVPGTSRASFYLYNTPQEVDLFIEAVKQARKVFKLPEPKGSGNQLPAH